ncbi:zinc-binding dehydrogenase [Streptomyces sp. NPDC058611]|uniref:zinc-binding dehydrogenase n=1 Tax=unclassified Streptomyces TaxID=2593676 RepID=UPI003666736D
MRAARGGAPAGEGQVRVKVAAAGVNGLDWKVRRGYLSGGEPLDAPMGTGMELSGTVDAVGPGVHQWRPGPQGVDAVLDCSGRGELPGSVALTGGPDRVVTIADPAGAAEHGVRFTGEAGSLAEAVTELLPLVEAGRVRIPIDAVSPLEEAADAQRHSEKGHLQGKVLIRPGA